MDASDIINKLKDRVPSILGYEQLRKSAVLLPLVEIANETHILFEVRSMELRNQPGDICFPGGRIDREDPDPRYSAVRETTEELGINESTIRDVLPLDYIAMERGRLIYPFVGRITNLTELKPNPAEVSEVFTVPLAHFVNTDPERYKVNLQVVPDSNFPFDLIVGGEDYNWRTHHVEELFYKYENKVIWGLTARILTHFIELLNEK
ncbi:NUDIX hydrolase [Oceanobacillus chungangensis]|uniref:Coenzyme A pyrophosphatase n=1 Tax=Oceanobacillus chungangensis TaxID=1229152 RepID=A0A3D8PQ68_9BACI|nr:CoA pyrophosphatase [Oceanobacillus chungangensis]RDW17388.1 coenzyme A pyrophosphatase [Oceanobacillus chungangensis]